MRILLENVLMGNILVVVVVVVVVVGIVSPCRMKFSRYEVQLGQEASEEDAKRGIKIKITFPRRKEPSVNLKCLP